MLSGFELYPSWVPLKNGRSYKKECVPRKKTLFTAFFFHECQVKASPDISYSVLKGFY